MFRINLKNKSFIKDGRYLIKDGEAQNGYSIRKEPVSVGELEELYEIFRNSIPTENDIKRKKRYFQGLGIDAIPFEYIVKGIPREQAQEKLELTILEGILNGSITWSLLTGTHPERWFWQSKKDKSFIILKEWIGDDNNE